MTQFSRHGYAVIMLEMWREWSPRIFLSREESLWSSDSKRMSPITLTEPVISTLPMIGMPETETAQTPSLVPFTPTLTEKPLTAACAVLKETRKWLIVCER